MHPVVAGRLRNFARRGRNFFTRAGSLFATCQPNFDNQPAEFVQRANRILTTSQPNLYNLPPFCFFAAALLVFDHQVTMHHRLVEAAYRARQSLFDSKLDPEETDVSKLSKGRSTDEFLEGRDKVVDYLLFRDETPIPKVSCAPAFQRAFAANRIADSRKRSLKDLRLDGRIFENRCSYMIYSPTFDQFPPMLKGAIYARIHEILTSPKPVEGFDYLGKNEKRRILEILDETKEDLPPGWL